MAVPAKALKLVDRWCEEQTPLEARERTRLDATVSGNRITIYECTRSPERDWLRVPSAQLRYDERTRVWALYWIDSNDKWHIVEATPTLVVEELLAEIDDDPDCLFFG